VQSETCFKRKRGGQPGNRNAAGNRGNRNARGKRGNRGGRAPFGNQNARKWPASLFETHKSEYGHSAEAVEWLERHADQLREVGIAGDEQRDAALYAALRGAGLHALAEQRRERAFGLYTLMEGEC
jgi:hypothetical protein